MHALFVHGMGRSPLSAWPMLRQLTQAGLRTHTFGYMVSLERFSRITTRLEERIRALASRGDDYMLIGHSLGGVLLRAALNDMPADTPRPAHVFLLGSPMRPSRFARRLQRNPLYRLITSDCGQLLASSERMAAIGRIPDPCTGIAGVRGLPLWKKSTFGEEPNDGVVSLSEISADWLAASIQVPTVHTLLPLNRRVGELILAQVGSAGPKRHSRTAAE